MPETTPLIKAALNLRGGAGFDVYVKAVISQELGKISRLAKENNWGKRKIQKEIRMLQSEVKKDLKKGDQL